MSRRTANGADAPQNTDGARLIRDVGGKRPPALTLGGAVVASTDRTRITIYIDNDILEDFRGRADASGHGCQTMIDEALRGKRPRSLPNWRS